MQSETMWEKVSNQTTLRQKGGLLEQVKTNALEKSRQFLRAKLNKTANANYPTISNWKLPYWLKWFGSLAFSKTTVYLNCDKTGLPLIIIEKKNFPDFSQTFYWSSKHDKSFDNKASDEAGARNLFLRNYVFETTVSQISWLTNSRLGIGFPGVLDFHPCTENVYLERIHWRSTSNIHSSCVSFKVTDFETFESMLRYLHGPLSNTRVLRFYLRCMVLQEAAWYDPTSHGWPTKLTQHGRLRLAMGITYKHDYFNGWRNFWLSISNSFN